MSDKEADKFNNINLSSDSDQGNKSNKKELSDALSNQAPLQQSSSSRRSLRRRKLCDSKVENKLIPTKKKKKRKAKKKEYTFHEITFKRDCSEINDSRFKGPCYCKSQTTKCIKLTEEDRKAIFEHVKSLPVDWRYGYVTELVRRLPIRGKYAMKKPSRKRSWVIYFHLTKLCGTILPVCKLMFLNTTGLTANFIHKSLLKKEIEDSQIIDTESLHYEGDNNKQKLASKSEHSDQHDVTKKELPDQHDDTPSLLCQFDDQNNPIVMTTPHSRTLHTTKPTSIQCEHVDKSDVDKSDTCHHQETLDADCSRLSPPPPTVAVEASEFHPITSSESSHLTASIVSCDNKYVDKSLQSMNMNHPSQFLTEDMWVPRHNKTPRDLGQSYISKRGKFVPARKLKDRCRCRSITTKCNQFTEDDRKAVFEYVWSLAKDEKKDFISDYVERLPVKRRRAMTSKKEWTFQFHLKKITGDVIPVCKKMFMKTTSLTSFLIRSVVAKKDSNYATMIEPGSLFYSKYSYDDQHDVSMDENPEPFNDTPSLVCQFDDQNNPIVVTSWESRFPQYSSDDKMPAVENGDDGEFSMPDNCSDSVSDSCMNTSSTLSLDPDANPNDEEEKQKLIEQVLERQNTLDDLSSRVDSVKVENLKLKSENQVLGQYIENLMAASSVFQSASPKAKKK